MKTLIKKHYTCPEVNRDILKQVLSENIQTNTQFSLSRILSLCVLVLLMLLFMKHFVLFNISYLDINGSLLSSVSLPVLFMLNIVVALIHFIYHNIFILGMLGMLYFILSLDSFVRRY